VLDADRCYEIIRSADRRFDGRFVTAVRTTGIYCRPSCPARTPLRRNVEFFAAAAGAQERGFRPCRRCRPDAAPGSPEWDQRADLAGRALRCIADGVMDREGTSGLAAMLGFSTRHISRELVAAVGAPPLVLARAQRVRTAVSLIERTDLAFAQIAFAAGFSSIRQFNETVVAVTRRSPTEIRGDRPAVRAEGGPIRLNLELPAREPFDGAAVVAFFAARAVAGVEWGGPGSGGLGSFSRVLDLPGGPATAVMTPTTASLQIDLTLSDPADLIAAVSRCRRLFDLDADTATIDEALMADPILAPWIAARPGLRVPGAADGFEMLVRAIVGQQVSVAVAVVTLGRIVELIGSGRFPRADELAAIDPELLAMSRSRAVTLVTAANAVADGQLDLGVGADRDLAVRALRGVRGIGPWTASIVALRWYRDPDVLPAGDAGIRRGLAAVGVTGPDVVRSSFERWSPWRSHAAVHLWANDPKAPDANAPVPSVIDAGNTTEEST